MAVSHLFGLNARRKFYLSIFLGFLSLFPSLTFAGKYETTRAIEYYENGEYRRAKSILSSTDITDDPLALYMMGAISLKDDESGDPTKNLNKAINWFEQSAGLNYPQAYHALGRTYEQRWLNRRNLDDYEKSKINYELAISYAIEIANNDLDRLTSSPAPGLDAEEEQRRIAVNNTTYAVTNTVQLAETGPLDKPVAEPQQSSAEGGAGAAPGDTEPARETRSNSWQMRPYIGITGNFFTIRAGDFSGRDTNTNTSVSFSESSSDSGSAAGLSGGVFLDESKKVGFSYFSGEEEDSSIMTLTVASIYVDHSFNNSGVHRGFFLGGGASYMEVETEENSVTSAGKTDSTGLLLRGGYEYLYDNNLFLELGIGIPLSELDEKLSAAEPNSNIEVSYKLQVSNIYFALNYLF